MKEELSPRERTANKLYVPLRILVLLSVVLLFFPALNPARMIIQAGQAKISGTASLFTCAISYGSLTDGLGRAFTKGWLEEGLFIVLFIACLLLVLGIAASAAAACMSIGNLKMKNLANKIGVAGGVGQVVGAVLILVMYFMIRNSADTNKITMEFPMSIWIYLVGSVLSFRLSLAVIMIRPKA